MLSAQVFKAVFDSAVIDLWKMFYTKITFRAFPPLHKNSLLTYTLITHAMPKPKEGESMVVKIPI